MTLNEIRTRLSQAVRQTGYYEQTNETLYPARWTYGEGAGDAMTATHYDRCIAVAAEHVARTLGLDMTGEFDDVLRQRDAASMIANQLRKQRAADVAEDAHADAVI